MYYNNINWSHPNEEDICGLEMPSSFNVGQELYVVMDFDSKDAVKKLKKFSPCILNCCNFKKYRGLKDSKILLYRCEKQP